MEAAHSLAPTCRLQAARAAFRHTFRQRVLAELLPALHSFEPDLLLLSSGFDAHESDRYASLTDEDYEWLTERLVEVADR